MIKRNITKSTQIKVSNYIKYMVKEEENQLDEEANEILQKLPLTLKEKIMNEAYGKIIKKIPIITKNFSLITLMKTLKICKEAKFSPEDMIFWVI